ncbi:unnamed protein product, partial [Ectocarpus sp. 12 AP-2014]
LSLPVSRPLSQEEYQRLQTHASEAPDFAYIGSIGGGEARGRLCGFSALACDSVTVESAASGHAFLAGLAGQMEQTVENHTSALSGSGDYLSGGWIGFLSYELGYVREKRLAPLCPNVDTPLLHAGFYLWTASHNRTSGTYYLWIHPACEQRTLETLARWLQSDLAPGPADWTMIRPFAPRQSARDYRDSVSAIRNYIS